MTSEMKELARISREAAINEMAKETGLDATEVRALIIAGHPGATRRLRQYAEIAVKHFAH